MEESVSLLNKILETFELDKQNPKQYSPLVLAYIGDTVYDLIIKTVIISLGNASVNRLHQKASKIVKAQAQAALIMSMEEELTEEEHGIFKRGRNAKSFTSAKNASITDYRTATGMEALLGYLYLTGQMDRALELVRRGLDKSGQLETLFAPIVHKCD
ncbi:MAG: ribonuclease III [Lachnospiraceae bacterium]|nr:ribonuclease III [Lachnospiraceae bacterium]